MRLPQLMTWYGDARAGAHVPLRADCGDREGPGPLNSTRTALAVPPGRKPWAPAAFFELGGERLLIAGLRPHTQATGALQPDVLRSDDGGRSWLCVGANHSWGAARAGAVAFSVARRLPPAAVQSGGAAAVVAAACVAGGRPLRFEGAAPTAATRDRLRTYSSGAAGGVFDAPVRDVWCTADGALWRAAAPLPCAVVGATHVRIVPAAPVADSSSGSSSNSSGSAQQPRFFDVLLGGWREDGGVQELWVAEYPPESAFNASDPLAAVLPSGWRAVRLPLARLTRTATAATWLSATQQLLLGGGEVPVDSLAGPDLTPGTQDLARRLSVDANATAQSRLSRALPEGGADLSTGTSRDAFALHDLVVVDGLVPLLLAPWQPAEQQPAPAARLTRLSLWLPDARTSGAPRAYALSSHVVLDETDLVDCVFFQSGRDVYMTFFGDKLGWPVARGFLDLSHTLGWLQARTPAAVAPVAMLGAANWHRHGLSVDGAFDYIVGASDTDGGLLRGSTARCELNASCVEGLAYSTGCREFPWDSQCAPCTRCTPGETYESTLCGVDRGDAVCSACRACPPGHAVAIACGMPGNPSVMNHVCELVSAGARLPLLGARGMTVVSAVLGVETALALLAVAALAAAAACAAPATADPLAAAARSVRLTASTALSVLTTTAVVTSTLALAGAAFVARDEELTTTAIVSCAAVCVGPVAMSAALALPDAWVCAVLRCGSRLQLREAVSAALRPRPLESAAVLLALPWRPQLLLSLAPLAAASAAPSGPTLDSEWGRPTAAAAAAAPASSSAAGGGPHSGAPAPLSSSVAAPPAWSPQQGKALRTLTLGVALLGDLPLGIASISWVLVPRASAGLRLNSYMALPVLSFVLCMWHLCSALMAVVESASRGPSQVAAAKLFGEAALSAPRSGEGAAARGDRAPQHRRRVDAAVPGDGSFPPPTPLHEGRQRPAPSGGRAGDRLDVPQGLLDAASAPSSLRHVAPAAVVVGNPLQQQQQQPLQHQPLPPQLPPNAGWQQQQQPRGGSARVPRVAAAVESSSAARGVTAVVSSSSACGVAACPAVHAAVESLSRELGVPPPSSSSPVGVENLQRIGELWARAATPEARRLADMSTFWSTHLALLPAALDGVLQSPLPPAWLRLLRALEGAERDFHRVRAVDSDTVSYGDEVAATSSEWSPCSSAPPSPAAAPHTCVSPARAP